MGKCGWKVMDTDLIAHEILRNSDVICSLVGIFGDRILSDTGHVSRPALAELVFNDPMMLAELNRLMHPRIRERYRSWVAEALSRGERCAVLIPLLFEVAEDEEWQAVCCVYAPRHIQIERLIGRGLARPDAVKRMDAQMACEEKMVRSDFVIVNDKSETILSEQVNRVSTCIGEG